jgi:hypothetical protein
MKKRVLALAVVVLLSATAAGAAPVEPEGTPTRLMEWWQAVTEAVAEWLIAVDEPPPAGAEGGGPSTQNSQSCEDCDIGPSQDPNG